jgi:hypothetical protein
VVVSKVGQPFYFDDEYYWDDFGKDDGDSITGIIEFAQMLVVTKEKSVWRMLNPYDPDALNIDRVTGDHGNVAPDSLCSLDNVLYFIDTDGGVFWNGAGFGLFTGKVNGYFDQEGDDAFPLPVIRSMRSVIWNRKMLISYPSKGVTSADKTVRQTSDVNSDAGLERKRALFDANFDAGTFQVGTDARLSLGNTQSGSDKQLEVDVYVPFRDVSLNPNQWFFQYVELCFFVSKDSGSTWKKEKVFRVSAQYDRGNKVVTPIQRSHRVTLYESGVTDIRMDFCYRATYSNIGLADVEYVELIGTTYQYDDVGTDMVNDRVLGFSIDSGKWDAPYVGMYANCWAIGDKANDLYELYFGDHKRAMVYQFGLGDFDDGKEIVGHFTTKHFGNKDGLTLFFDRVLLKLLDGSGEFTLVVYVDLVEKLRKTFNPVGQEKYFGSARWRRAGFGGNQALVQLVVSLAREGQFVTLQVIRHKSVEMTLFFDRVLLKLLDGSGEFTLVVYVDMAGS